MLRRTAITSTLLGLALSGSAMAYDFSAADSKFANRAAGTTDQEKFESARKARDAYVSIVEEHEASDSGILSEDELVYAVSQAGRIDLYRAGMLAGVKIQDRRDAAEGCYKFTKSKISHTDRQEYYYYYLGCVALRGKIANGFLDRAKYGLLMKGIEEAALQSTTDENGDLKPGYEGAGILRVMSAVRGNVKADPLGLYNPEEGLEFAKITLSAPKTKLPPFQSSYSGRDMFENYYYYGQAVIALGLKNEDLDSVLEGSKLLKKISTFVNTNESKLHPERKPERDYYVDSMLTLAGQVEGCKSNANWKKCLQTELEKE